MTRFPLWVCCLAGVLAMRLIYVARFGADGSWMNWNYLFEAKFFLTGIGQQEHGPPLCALVLAGLRALGIGPLAALSLVYLCAHALIGLGTLRLARTLWPEASARRLLALSTVVAVVPLLSLSEGYGNLAPVLGTALFVNALAGAAALSTQAAPRLRQLAGTAVFAALAAACRFEVLTGTLAAVGVLAFAARRWATPRARLASAGALAAGAFAGLAFTFATRAAFSGAAEASSASYLYYTFFDGLPLAMWPESAFERPTEYARYAASLGWFGSYEENGGSVLRAVARNPGAAALRVVAKVPDIAGTLAWVTGLTPLGVALALAGLRRLREGGRAVLLLAYAGVAVPLLLPTPWTSHLVPLAPPLCLAAACGVERLLARTSRRRSLGIAAVVLGLSGSAVALAGGREPATTPLLNVAVARLEALCRGGCLTNYLPQGLAAQVWSDTGKGSPLPPKCKTCESFARGRPPAEFREGCRFMERVRRAARHGARALYVDVRSATRLFDPDFDPERRYEGPVDLAQATLLWRAKRGAERVSIYSLALRRGAAK